MGLSPDARARLVRAIAADPDILAADMATRFGVSARYVERVRRELSLTDGGAPRRRGGSRRKPRGLRRRR